MQLLNETTTPMRDFEVSILPNAAEEVQFIVRDTPIDKQKEESALHAQKLASLGLLAGGIAHDFNNLLTGMLAHASLAKLKLLKGLPAVEHIDKVVLSAERAADLTRQLLAYAGKGKFQIVPLDINQLIRETTGLLQTALPSHIELKLELANGLPRIEADHGQIQQVVMNLFMNAVEALNEKAGFIKISTAFQQITETNTKQGYIVGNLRPGPYLSLQVTDSGMGMDQTVFNRIFDPFFSTKPKGHGLGLSATIGIIRTYQGGLAVQSQPGRGTTFIILLPALELESTQLHTAPSLVATDTNQQQTILVIDDHDEVREVVYDILTDHGFTVVTAVSGDDGIEQFRRLQKQVGVVLLDMKMPGMSGKRMYEQLQKIEPAIKVIFTSGSSEGEVAKQIGNRQVLPFLAKPYSAESLIRYIQQALLSVEPNPSRLNGFII